MSNSVEVKFDEYVGGGQIETPWISLCNHVEKGKIATVNPRDLMYIEVAGYKPKLLGHVYPGTNEEIRRAYFSPILDGNGLNIGFKPRTDLKISRSINFSDTVGPFRWGINFSVNRYPGTKDPYSSLEQVLEFYFISPSKDDPITWESLLSGQHEPTEVLFRETGYYNPLSLNLTHTDRSDNEIRNEIVFGSSGKLNEVTFKGEVLFNANPKGWRRGYNQSFLNDLRLGLKKLPVGFKNAGMLTTPNGEEMLHVTSKYRSYLESMDIPTSLNTLALFRNFFPEDLVRDPRSPDTSLDDFWKNADLSTELGLNNREIKANKTYLR